MRRKIDSILGNLNKSIPALLQFNVSGEVSKFGFSARDEDKWSLLIPEITSIMAHPNLKINGFMTMPPLGDPEVVRPNIKKLRRLKNYLIGSFQCKRIDELSMGISNEYKVAVEEGATIVRISQDILGEQQKILSKRKFELL